MEQYQAAVQFNPKADWVLHGDALNGVGRRTAARATWKKVVGHDGTEFYDGRLAHERLTKH